MPATARPRVRRGVVVFLLLTLVSAASAQRFEIGGNLGAGFPQSQFGRNVDRAGVGLNAYGGLAPADLPFFLGFRVGYFNYGSEQRRDILAGQFTQIDADVTTTNNIVMLQLCARLQPNVGSLRPYVEGFLGWNYLYTLTTVKGEFTGDEISNDVNLDDGAFTYGGGGGIQIMLTGPPDPEEGEEAAGSGLALDIGARYGFGGKAKYLKEGSIMRVGDSFTYTVLESTTDLIMIHVGVAYHF